mmetsp:Transcript_25899/g.44665  ORF Transcript_25899/g.44665 Transcript_25899/m.44665 type:complete len:508 (-) Transcript_25899:191-1714(-)
MMGNQCSAHLPTISNSSNPQHQIRITQPGGQMFECPHPSKRKSATFQDEVVANTSLNLWQKIKQLGSHPLERSGHEICQINSKAYMFGGCGDGPDTGGCLSDFHAFDFETMRWSSVRCKGEMPGARASFSMCKGPEEGTLIIAGGTADDGIHNDVFEFCTYTRTFRKLGESPFCQFYGQSMVVYGRKIIFFGGSSGHHYVNDVCSFDVDTNRWEKLLTTGTAPSPRYKQQCVVVGDKMYLMGGGAYRPRAGPIHVYCLDLNTWNWQRLVCRGHNGSPLPAARVAHSCQFDPVSQCILLWGGFTKTLSRLGDFHMLHLPSLRWHTLAFNGVRPCPRAFHSSCLYGDAFWLFNGADGETRFSDVWRFQLRVNPPTLMTLAAQNQRLLLASGRLLKKPRSAKRQQRMFTSQSLPAEVTKGIEDVAKGCTWQQQSHVATHLPLPPSCFSTITRSPSQRSESAASDLGVDDIVDDCHRSPPVPPGVQHAPSMERAPSSTNLLALMAGSTIAG